MKNLLFTALICILATVNSYAQTTFAQAFHYNTLFNGADAIVQQLPVSQEIAFQEIANSVVQTNSGRFVFTGTIKENTATNAKTDVLLVKTDAAGNVLVKKRIGGAQDDAGIVIAKSLTNSDLVVAANTKSFGAGKQDFLLMRLDSNLNITQKVVVGDTADERVLAMAAIPGDNANAGFIFVGGTKSFGYGGEDVFVMRTNSSLTPSWKRACGGAGNDVAKDVKLTSDGGFILTGWTESYTTSRAVYLIKLNSQGTQQWKRIYNVDDFFNFSGESVQQTPDGGYMILASRDQDFVNNRHGAVVIRTDANGNIIASQTKQLYPVVGDVFREIKDLEASNDGNYIFGINSSIGDLFGNPFYGSNNLLVKVSPDGNVVWQKKISLAQNFPASLGDGPDNYSGINSFKQTGDGGIVFCGAIYSQFLSNFDYIGPIGSELVRSANPDGNAVACAPLTTVVGNFVQVAITTTLPTTVAPSVSTNVTSSSPALVVTSLDANYVNQNLCCTPAQQPVCGMTIAPGCINYVASATAGMAHYAWSDGTTNQSVVVTGRDVYSVFMIAPNGCANFCSNFIDTTYAPSIQINGSSDICAGTTTVFTGPPGMTSYVWSTGATAQNISVNQDGFYRVTVTNSSGCTGVAVKRLSVWPNPTPSINGTASICPGTSSLFVSPTSYEFSYLWSTGQTTDTITATASATYSVTVTAFHLCSASASRTFTLLPAPPASITGSSTICPGTSTLFCAGSSASYLWNTGATTPCIIVASPATYAVTVTGNNGCAATASKSLLSGVPSCGITGTNTICPLTSSTFTSTSGMASYSWSTGASTRSISVSGAGTYTVTVTGSSGCTSSCSRILTVSCPTPFLPSTTNITSSTAFLNWKTNACAIGYNVQYRKTGTATFTSVSAPSTTNASTFLNVTGLSAGSTYEWKVRTQCTAGLFPSYSAFTNLLTFTTTGNAWPTRLDIDSVTDADVHVFCYPNPATHSINVETDGFGYYEVHDMLGRRVLQATYSDLKFEIDVADLPTGMYVLTVVQKGLVFRQKIAKK